MFHSARYQARKEKHSSLNSIEGSPTCRLCKVEAKHWIASRVWETHQWESIANISQAWVVDSSTRRERESGIFTLSVPVWCPSYLPFIIANRVTLSLFCWKLSKERKRGCFSWVTPKPPTVCSHLCQLQQARVLLALCFDKENFTAHLCRYLEPWEERDSIAV